MASVHLVTDSTSYLPADMVERYNIRIVPLRVNWSTESMREGVDIEGQEFFNRLRHSQEVPTTSQPPVGEFASCYRELGREGGSIISIHISGI